MKFRPALVIFTLIFICLSAIYTYGGSPSTSKKVVRVEQKQVVAGDRIIVKGIPVSDYAPLYYYEVNKSKLNLSNDEIDTIATQIADKILEKLTKAFEDALGGLIPVNPDDKPAPAPVPQPPSKPTPTPEPSLEDLVVDILHTHKCHTCHGSARKEGGIELFDVSGKFNIIDSMDRLKWDIWDAVATNRMPLNGQPLSQEEVDIILEWARKK